MRLSRHIPEFDTLFSRRLPSGMPSLTIGDVALAEGLSGQTAFVFTVRLSEASSRPVSVRYATADGTAKASDNDYVRAAGTLQFNPGETVKTITVFVRGDAKWEPDETFYVRLSRASNAGVADSLGIGLILRDEIGGTSAGNPATVPDENPPGDGY